MRLIDADALMKQINNCVFTADMTTTLATNMACRWIENAPTIEPERKKGRWVVYKAPDQYHCGLIKCPFCDEDMIAESDEYNFCPSCGADLKGE